MLAPDDLFILDLTNGENNSRWIKMKTNGDSPGKRYGHSMIYYRPFLIIFGGNLGNRLTNEVYITQVEEKISSNESKDSFIWGLKDSLNWNLLETKGLFLILECIMLVHFVVMVVHKIWLFYLEGELKKMFL